MGKTESLFKHGDAARCTLLRTPRPTCGVHTPPVFIADAPPSARTRLRRVWRSAAAQRRWWSEMAGGVLCLCRCNWLFACVYVLWTVKVWCSFLCVNKVPCLESRNYFSFQWDAGHKWIMVYKWCWKSSFSNKYKWFECFTGYIASEVKTKVVRMLKIPIFIIFWSSFTVFLFFFIIIINILLFGNFFFLKSDPVRHFWSRFQLKNKDVHRTICEQVDVSEWGGAKNHRNKWTKQGIDITHRKMPYLWISLNEATSVTIVSWSRHHHFETRRQWLVRF